MSLQPQPIGFVPEVTDFIARECTTREELAQHAGDADVVWVCGGNRIVAGKAERCRHHCSVGW